MTVQFELEELAFTNTCCDSLVRCDMILVYYYIIILTGIFSDKKNRKQTCIYQLDNLYCLCYSEAMQVDTPSPSPRLLPSQSARKHNFERKKFGKKTETEE